MCIALLLARFYFIPFLLEAAAVLATFVHPNYIVCLCSWGFTHLPPTCNSKSFRYNLQCLKL
ncbi:hypothetical protein B4939_10950 [Vibrio cholerae]|nr:hypothetical protein [Vibrio cholerae]MCD1225673.1 hypothetical protein [Vibrio cholerae]MCD1229920.1 hypothetical protein [Vibrio cholerae]